MTGLRRSRTCRMAAGWLVAIAEGRLDDPRALDALEHVGACGDCRREAERLSLLVFQLRRLGDAEQPWRGHTVPHPADGSWEAVRARIERGRSGWRGRAMRWRADLGGLFLSVVVIAAAVGPMAVHAPFGGGGAEPTGGQADQWDRQAWLIEASYDAQRRPDSTTTTTGSPSDPRSGYASIPRSVPDRLLPTRKEVPFDRATDQPADAVDRAAGPS